jgi:hypothetical protein
MDNLVFEESITTETDQSEFTEKKWVYVNDNNAQNYSSQVVIDSTPLSNAGGYVNWSEGYILMPLVVEATAASGLEDADSHNMMGFKNGYWNMINSMSVEFNNQTIVQQTPFLNVFRSFKAHTSFSESDVINHGNELGYALDTPSSWGYDISDNLSGRGIFNNEYAPATSGHALTTNWDLGSHNEGLRKRMENTNKFSSGKGKSDVVAEATRGLLYQSRCVSKSATSVVWEVYAKLRLKDLTDYFEKVPLLKGSTMRFLINTNQAEVSFTPVVDASGNGTLPVAQASVLSGNTFPLIVTSQKAPSATASGGKNSLDTNVAVRLSVDIVKSRQSGHQTSLTSCRLYAPLYKFNPLAEQRYLSLAPTKRVEYEDVFQYQFNGVNAGDTFNFLVSNGISDIQSVLVVPFLSSSANDGMNPFLSPYSTAGATPDPVPLQQFNILLSGVNLFLENEEYDFQAFSHQLASSNQLNGGLTTGLGSGLIGKFEFENLYRYYYGNSSRSLPSEEGVSRSVQIVGKNASAKQISLMVFVVFKRSMTVDIQTGARIM